MQPDGAVHPDDEQQRGLRPGRIAAPYQSDQKAILVIDAVKLVCGSGKDDVGDQKERDDESQTHLQSFAQRHAPGAPCGHPRQCQRRMGQQGSVKKDGAHKAAGDQLAGVLKRLHCCGGDQPKSNVDKVEDRIGKEHQPTGNAQSGGPTAAP